MDLMFDVTSREGQGMYSSNLFTAKWELFFERWTFQNFQSWFSEAYIMGSFTNIFQNIPILNTLALYVAVAVISQDL